jgi:hypothetical protein
MSRFKPCFRFRGIQRRGQIPLIKVILMPKRRPGMEEHVVRRSREQGICHYIDRMLQCTNSILSHFPWKSAAGRLANREEGDYNSRSRYLPHAREKLSKVYY